MDCEHAAGHDFHIPHRRCRSCAGECLEESATKNVETTLQGQCDTSTVQRKEGVDHQVLIGNVAWLERCGIAVSYKVP